MNMVQKWSTTLLCNGPLVMYHLPNKASVAPPCLNLCNLLCAIITGAERLRMWSGYNNHLQFPKPDSDLNMTSHS